MPSKAEGCRRMTKKAAKVALHKVYGPPQPGDPPPPPGVWTRRYFLDPQWKGFRKWFQETYAATPNFRHGKS